MSRDEKKFLSQAEVQKAIFVSLRTLERWRWNGIGPKFCKHAKQIKYRRSDVDEFIEKHKLEKFGED